LQDIELFPAGNLRLVDEKNDFPPWRFHMSIITSNNDSEKLFKQSYVQSIF